MYMRFQLVVWLEVHLKLNSNHKLFCACANEQDFDMLEPNTHICPTCTAQPWALPVLQNDALDLALRLGSALWCTIQTESHFDRKSYFYPDLPNGYQITQYYQPTAIDWNLSFFVDNEFSEQKAVGIQDAHMETDTGKTIHIDGEALLDYNRAGTPLVEIVTKPDFRKIDEVLWFCKELQRIARYNSISFADMEKWQMRVDVNVSICEQDAKDFGTRIELKNLNSFAAIKRAIEHEYQRQINLYMKWEPIQQSTRWRDDQKWISYLMRSKEDALDYRYFPEPDLPTLFINEEQKVDYHAVLPSMLISDMKEKQWFNKEYINWLISDVNIYNYYLYFVNSWFDPKVVAKRIVWPILSRINTKAITIDELPFTKSQFFSFLQVIWEWYIHNNQLKLVMDKMLETWENPNSIVESQWFWQSDDIDYDYIITNVLENNQDVVTQYKNGKTSTISFFIWQVMKASKWKADPNEIHKKLQKYLDNY